MKKFLSVFMVFALIFGTANYVNADTSTKMHVDNELQSSIESMYLVLLNGETILMNETGGHYDAADGGAYNHALIDYFLVNGLRAYYITTVEGDLGHPNNEYSWVSGKTGPLIEQEANGTGNYKLLYMPEAPLLEVEKVAVEGDGSSVPKTTWNPGDTVWFKISVSNPTGFEFSSLELNDIETGDLERLINTSSTYQEFWVSLVAGDPGEYENEVVIDGYVEVISGPDQTATFNVASAVAQAPYVVEEPFVPYTEIDVTKLAVAGENSHEPQFYWEDGENVWFRIGVENLSNLDVQNFVFSDELLEIGDQLIDEAILIGDTTYFWLPYEGAVITDSLNEVFVTAYLEYESETLDTSDSASAEFGIMPNGDIEVVKLAVEGDQSDVPKLQWEDGETIWFKVSVTNHGNFDIVDFTYDDALLGLSDVFVNQGIPMGDTIEFWLSYEGAEISDDENVIEVWAYNDEFSEEPAYDFGLAEFEVLPNLDIAVSKVAVESDGSDVAKFEWEDGETIWFKVSVENLGNIPVQGFAYDDPLLFDNPVLAEITIPVGGSYEFWLSYVGALITDSENYILVTGFNDDYELEVSDDALAPFVVLPNPVLRVVKTAVANDLSDNPDMDWYEGDTVWFKIDLMNEGNVPFDFIKFDDVDLGIFDAYVNDGLEGVSLLPGEEFSFWLSLEDAQIGNFLNVIEARAYQDGEEYLLLDEASAEAPYYVYPIPIEYFEDFNLDKRVVSSESNPVTQTSWYIDQTITFEFTVTNTGNVPIDGLWFADPMLSVADEFLDVQLVAASSESDADTYVFYRTYNSPSVGDFTNEASIIAEYYQGEYELERVDEVDFSVRNRPVRPTYYTVTAVSNPAGVAGFTGTGTGFGFGSSYNVSFFDVSPGYQFVGWNQAPSGTITGNVSLIANFELVTYSVTAVAIPEGAATFLGERTGLRDGADYRVVIFEIADGYEFVEWLVPNSGVIDGVDVEVVAVFQPVEDIILDEEIAEEIIDELPDEELPEAGGIPLPVNILFGSAVSAIGAFMKRKNKF